MSALAASETVRRRGRLSGSVDIRDGDTRGKATERALKSQLMHAVSERVAQLDITQSEIAALLGTSQPRVSDLLHSKVDQFTLSALVRHAVALGLEPTIQIVDRASAGLAASTRIGGRRTGTADRAGSSALEGISPPLATYAWFADLVAREPDWRFAVRVLRQVVMKASRLTQQSDTDTVHAEPPSTGHRGWDALIAGVASMTGRNRVSSPDVLAWCFAPARYSDRLFDPLDSGRYIWLEYMRTPVELRERNVILAAGNLEGA
jgi:predicted XRE-type DNA-binding protein